MKNQEIQNLFNALQNIPDTKKMKFDYAVLKNLKTLTPIVRSFNEKIKISNELKTFDSERIKICREFAEKTDTGEPKIERGIYKFPNEEASSLCTKKIDELRSTEPHKTAVDEYEKQMKDYDEFMQQETEVELFKVNIEHVPDGIPRPLLNEILPMIEE